MAAKNTAKPEDTFAVLSRHRDKAREMKRAEPKRPIATVASKKGASTAKDRLEKAKELVAARMGKAKPAPALVVSATPKQKN